MSRPLARRAALGAALPSLAALTAPATATPPPLPDAELLAMCDRWFALVDTSFDHWRQNYPRTTPDTDAMDDAAGELFDAIGGVTPTTMTGVGAVARVALRQAADIDMDDDGPCGTVLACLVRGDAAFEARMALVRSERSRIGEEMRARIADAFEERRKRREAEDLARPRTSEDRARAVKAAERTLLVAEDYLRKAKDDLRAARYDAGMAT